MSKLKSTLSYLLTVCFLLSFSFVAYADIDIQYGNASLDCSGATPQLCVNLEVKATTGTSGVGNSNFFLSYNVVGFAFASYTPLNFTPADGDYTNTGSSPGGNIVTVAVTFNGSNATAVQIDDVCWTPIGRICFDVTDQSAALTLSNINGGVTDGDNNVVPNNPDIGAANPGSFVYGVGGEADCANNALCTAPTATFTPTCLDASTYEVVVDVTNLGSYSPIDVVDDILGFSQEICEPTMITLGPYNYSAGDMPTISVQDQYNANCVTSSVEMCDATCQASCASPTCTLAVASVTPTCQSPLNDTYDLVVELTYSASDNPGGDITVTAGSDTQSVTSDNSGAQSVTFIGLTADGGTSIGVTAAFDALFQGEVCEDAMGMTYNEPDCTPCTLSIDSAVPTCQDPLNGTYDLVITVSYGGSTPGGLITINANDGDNSTGTIDSDVNETTLTLTGLTADGENPNITASFDNNTACSAINLNYPEPSANCALPCAITIDDIMPSACDPIDNTYTLDVTVTYSNAPISGNIRFFVGSAAPQGAVTMGTSGTETFTLTNLMADGATTNITAEFIDDLACTNTDAFMAPVSCGCTATAAVIETTDPTTICAGDGVADPINVTISSGGAGTTVQVQELV